MLGSITQSWYPENIQTYISCTLTSGESVWKFARLFMQKGNMSYWRSICNCAYIWHPLVTCVLEIADKTHYSPPLTAWRTVNVWCGLMCHGSSLGLMVRFKHNTVPANGLQQSIRYCAALLWFHDVMECVCKAWVGSTGLPKHVIVQWPLIALFYDHLYLFMYFNNDDIPAR